MSSIVLAGFESHAQFKSAVDVVTINATVTGRSGEFVSGLHKDDFTVFEDGQARDVVYFEYLRGYSTTARDDGRRHTIRVDARGRKVHAREAFQSPGR